MTSDEARRLLGEALARIAPEIPLAEADPAGDLRDEFDLDSIDFLSLVSALHDRAGIDVPEQDYPRLSSVTECVAYLVDAT